VGGAVFLRRLAAFLLLMLFISGFAPALDIGSGLRMLALSVSYADEPRWPRGLAISKCSKMQQTVR